MTRRFIEEHFPIRKVSKESSRERTIRHGHISTLHLWWARRPLAASRATIYASLIPAPDHDDDEEAKCRNLEIARLSEWANPIDREKIDKARKRILDHNNGAAPKVLDPFAGGGSIPLEALRLGCDVYAIDYNPVSNLIVKAAIEYPFQQHDDQGSGLKPHTSTELIDDVKMWSQWVLEEARNELAEFFPSEKEGEPIGYLWSRCIPCQNPRCGATVPLIKQFWLANTKKKKITLIPSVKGKKMHFGIAGGEKAKIPKEFDPKDGTVNGGKATCLICGRVMDRDTIKSLFAQEKNDEIMNVVVIKPKGRSGKLYKIATKNNLDVFKKASKRLEKKQRIFKKKHGIDPIPNESTPEGKGSGAERAFSVRLYNMNTWGSIFNSRQKLVMLTFLEKILEIADMKGNNKCNIKVLSYLGIILDRLADKDTTLCMWNTSGEKLEHVFGRQTLPMIWDYAEVNPFTSVGWPNMEEWVMRVMKHLEGIDAKPAIVKHTTATALPFEDGFFDAVITDPPYYDNVPYSHLSDFFYVWLKRVLGTRMPELFSTPLTPKGDEIVAYSNGPGGLQGGKEFFEDMLKKSFQEIHRVLKPDGISVIVYAHKSTDGWETLINSILRSGLVVTAAWPIHTEMKSRLRSKKSAALLSSIYMVCRKLEKEHVGFYRDVKRDLKRYLNKKLDQLWNEGISGADFFIASIGSAIEVYGKYDRVIDDKDQDVSVKRMLDDTRTIVTNYAIDKVSRGEFANRISKMTRFYILWRWAHGEAKARFDEARKLAQSVGIDLTNEWNAGFIRKEKEYVRIVGPDEREHEKLEKSDELIDVLHHALRLWKGQKIDEANKFLDTKGYKNSEVMRRVAQAVSESLSDINCSKEKDWIDGMFTGALSAQDLDQTKLF